MRRVSFSTLAIVRHLGLTLQNNRREEEEKDESGSISQFCRAVSRAGPLFHPIIPRYYFFTPSHTLPLYTQIFNIHVNKLELSEKKNKQSHPIYISSCLNIFPIVALDRLDLPLFLGCRDLTGWEHSATRPTP